MSNPQVLSDKNSITGEIRASDTVFTVNPSDQPFFEMFTKHGAMFWMPDEIQIKNDISDWNKLSEDERKFIKQILAFFAASDGLVNMNLLERFLEEAENQSIKAFYSMQHTIEMIHARTYAMLIENYVTDHEERDYLFNAIHNIPSIKRKAEWTIKWINDEEAPFAQRLVAFAIVEGVFFSGAFCSIFWFKKRNLLKGLIQSNELISRDEGLHTDFAVLLYNTKVKGEDKLTTEEIHYMFREALDCERMFISDSLPVEMIGMNDKLMIQYVEYVADQLLIKLKYPPLFRVENPFDWMNMISMDTKANFFERETTEYQKYEKKAFNVLDMDDL